jgi:hypothetical protein
MGLCRAQLTQMHCPVYPTKQVELSANGRAQTWRHGRDQPVERSRGRILVLLVKGHAGYSVMRFGFALAYASEDNIGGALCRSNRGAARASNEVVSIAHGTGHLFASNHSRDGPVADGAISSRFLTASAGCLNARVDRMHTRVEPTTPTMTDASPSSGVLERTSTAARSSSATLRS